MIYDFVWLYVQLFTLDLVIMEIHMFYSSFFIFFLLIILVNFDHDPGKD